METFIIELLLALFLGAFILAYLKGKKENISILKVLGMRGSIILAIILIFKIAI